MRVALVTSSYNFIADGVALTLNRLVGYLKSQGVEVARPEFLQITNLAPTNAGRFQQDVAVGAGVEIPGDAS